MRRPSGKGRPIRRLRAVPNGPGRCQSDPVGSGFLSDANAACRSFCAAADMGMAFRVVCPGGATGGVVLTTTSATSSPRERAASRIWGEASRSLACHTGASTTNTSLPRSRLASRACAANEGGRWGRNRRSTLSSHKARRNVFPAGAAMSTSSASWGEGGEGGDR